MRTGFVIAWFFAVAGPACADTLADMRQDLAGLLVESNRLHRELTTTQSAGFVHYGSLLDRTLEIELELQRLTAQTEALAFRIGVIVEDANARIQDMERRLCDLEPGCEVGDLGATLPLGGVQPGDILDDVPIIGPALTLTEQNEFDISLAALNDGDVETAIVLFRAFLDSFPVGPLTQSAQLYLGNAYMETGAHKLAARAFLESYSIDETTATAPDALLNLGIAFHKMGKEKEGCLTLEEVQFRFEGLSAELDAKDTAAALNCA